MSFLKLSGKEWTRTFFYAMCGGSFGMTTISLWFSALHGFAPIVVDFNQYGEGFTELLIMTWGAIYLLIYISWRIQNDYQVKQ